MSLPAIRAKLVMAALVVAVSGCSKNPPPLVAASGKVQSNGKGVPNAVVQFIPDLSKNPNGCAAQATTDAEGAFSLKTPPHGDGASPGWYRVTVVGYGDKLRFAKKYTQFDKTPFLIEIPQGGKRDVLLKVD